MRLVCMECNHIFENEEEVLSYDDDDLSCYFCDCSCLKDFFMSYARYEVIKVKDEQDGDAE